MGAAALLRQTLLDAKRDLDWSRRYERDPRGMPRPEIFPGLVALRPVLERTEPLLLEAASADDLLLADRIAREMSVESRRARERDGGGDRLAGRQERTHARLPRRAFLTSRRWRTRMRRST
jgi:hypothetical protein